MMTNLGEKLTDEEVIIPELQGLDKAGCSLTSREGCIFFLSNPQVGLG